MIIWLKLMLKWSVITFMAYVALVISSLIWIPLCYWLTSPDWEDDMQSMIPIEKVEIKHSSHSNSAWGSDYGAEFIIKVEKAEDRELIIQDIKKFNNSFTREAIIKSAGTYNSAIIEPEYAQYFPDGISLYQFPYKTDKKRRLFVTILIGLDGYFDVSYSIFPDRSAS